jgi:hypothetical protein
MSKTLKMYQLKATEVYSENCIHVKLLAEIKLLHGCRTLVSYQLAILFAIHMSKLACNSARKQTTLLRNK